MPKCSICQWDFIGRDDAKTCSSRCRQILYRMKRTPIEETIILDLTDHAAQAKLRKVLDVIAKEANENPNSWVHTVGGEAPPGFWEPLIPGYTGNDPIVDAMIDIAMNNPKNWQPAKYRRKAKAVEGRAAAAGSSTPEWEDDELPF